MVYRFAIRPRWVLSHLLVLVLVVTFVNLGFWQLRRLDQKRAANEVITSRAELAPAEVEDLAAPGDPVEVGDRLAFRTAEATGVYLSDSVLVRSRSLDGQPGFWVLTTLDLGSGDGVLVNRGWVPFRERTDGSDTDLATPTGRVSVSGLVQSSVAGAEPSGEDRTTVAHVDVEWLDQQSELDLYPFFVQMAAQEPAPEELPVMLDAPEPGEGPHLGYAVQWFVFAAIAVCGYPLILRRVAAEQGLLPPHDTELTSMELTDA